MNFALLMVILSSAAFAADPLRGDFDCLRGLRGPYFAETAVTVIDTSDDGGVILVPSEKGKKGLFVIESIDTEPQQRFVELPAKVTSKEDGASIYEMNQSGNRILVAVGDKGGIQIRSVTEVEGGETLYEQKKKVSTLSPARQKELSDRMGRDATDRFLGIEKRLNAAIEKSGLPKEKYYAAHATDLQEAYRALLKCSGAMTGFREPIQIQEKKGGPLKKRIVGLPFYLDPVIASMQKIVPLTPPQPVAAQAPPKAKAADTQIKNVDDDILDAYPDIKKTNPYREPSAGSGTR